MSLQYDLGSMDLTEDVANSLMTGTENSVRRPKKRPAESPLAGKTFMHRKSDFEHRTKGTFHEAEETVPLRIETLKQTLAVSEDKIGKRPAPDLSSSLIGRILRPIYLLMRSFCPAEWRLSSFTQSRCSRTSKEEVSEAFKMYLPTKRSSRSQAAFELEAGDVPTQDWCACNLHLAC